MLLVTLYYSRIFNHPPPKLLITYQPPKYHEPIGGHHQKLQVYMVILYQVYLKHPGYYPDASNLEPPTGAKDAGRIKNSLIDC